MRPRYMIGSGYFCRPKSGMEWFHHIWFENTMRYASPERVLIVSSGNHVAPNAKGEWLVLSGDAGNAEDIITKKRQFIMPGCPCSWMILAMIAYANEMDLIYKEQDCLCFGPWVKRLYDEMGKKSVVFGTNKIHGSSTTLFLIRHSYLPQFVYSYLGQGPETVINRIPERKFGRLADQDPENWARHTMGYDSDRPFNREDTAWFAQKFTPLELRALDFDGLLSTAGMPEGVELFSNNNP